MEAHGGRCGCVGGVSARYTATRARRPCGDAAAQSAEEGVSITTLAAVGIATLLGVWTLGAQEPVTSGPTVTAARAAFFVPAGASRERAAVRDTSSTCGSALKNAAML